MSDVSLSGEAGGSRLYRAIWRWHFYAGLVVVPFLLVLAITGMIMVYGNSVDTFLGPRHSVSAVAAPASVVAQAATAQSAIPGGQVTMFVSPATDREASLFVVDARDGSHVVAIDPDGAKLMDSYLRDGTWFNWASNIHATLLLGDVGDRMIEVAAGLGVILVLTGLYMWWPRGRRSLAKALVPSLGKGRVLWRNLHQSTGFYASVVLLFFFVSGLAWTGVWGDKFVQAWSSFPAAKWDSVPLSDSTHAGMNHGPLKEVPWALEKTPMPASGSQAGAAGVPDGVEVNLESIVALARSSGFDGQFRVNLPEGETGVYTISADSMDGDTSNPLGDRTVHVDQYTGKVLAEVGFADYSLMGQAMAVGIALHQGNIGWWNTLLNFLFCSAVTFMASSGVVMWWKRRPKGSLAAPRYAKAYRAPGVILGIGLAVCAAFPLTGLAVILFAAVDFLLPRRLKEAGAS